MPTRARRSDRKWSTFDPDRWLVGCSETLFVSQVEATHLLRKRNTDYVSLAFLVISAHCHYFWVTTHIHWDYRSEAPPEAHENPSGQRSYSQWIFELDVRDHNTLLTRGGKQHNNGDAASITPTDATASDTFFLLTLVSFSFLLVENLTCHLMLYLLSHCSLFYPLVRQQLMKRALLHAEKQLTTLLQTSSFRRPSRTKRFQVPTAPTEVGRAAAPHLAVLPFPPKAEVLLDTVPSLPPLLAPQRTSILSGTVPPRQAST